MWIKKMLDAFNMRGYMEHGLRSHCNSGYCLDRDDSMRSAAWPGDPGVWRNMTGQ
jgi:hypothetical protein